MSQYGIGYMQLTVMKHDQLIEKHLAKAGLKDTKVTWAKLGAGAAANDALYRAKSGGRNRVRLVSDPIIGAHGKTAGDNADAEIEPSARIG